LSHNQLINHHNNMAKIKWSKERKIGVYKIFFDKSPEFYIGSSYDLYGRFVRHTKLFKRGIHTKKIQEAYNKNGDYSVEILTFCKKEEIKDIEQKYLDENKSNPNLCNIALDSRASLKGLKRSPQAIEKLKKWISQNKSYYIERSIGKNNPRAKKVINIKTGKVYGCAKDVANEIGMVVTTFRSKLCNTGGCIQDTDYMYLDDYLSNKDCSMDDFLANRAKAA